MRKQLHHVVWIALIGAVAGSAIAQRQRARNASYQTAREAESNSVGTPNWTVEKGFQKDVFTFVRIKYSSRGGYGRWSGYNRWEIDFPDSDLNLSYRLQQLTSLKVDPDTRVIEITDKELFDYPWIYIVEPGGLQFTDEEVPILREYLLNGGFLMVDDFWGEAEWANFYREIKRVFPARELIELPLDHPIYHCVFDITSKGQVPNIHLGVQSQYTGVTWERPDAKDVHHRAIFDDKGRMMVIACHNTDNGDGWEREGESDYYFHNFSEKIAYPLGINIIFYAMTH
ncbi:MAG: DUF4159 domain-containing protein [Verrucomicrobiota bacterium]